MQIVPEETESGWNTNLPALMIWKYLGNTDWVIFSSFFPRQFGLNSVTQNLVCSLSLLIVLKWISAIQLPWGAYKWQKAEAGNITYYIGQQQNQVEPYFLSQFLFFLSLWLLDFLMCWRYSMVCLLCKSEIRAGMWFLSACQRCSMLYSIQQCCSIQHMTVNLLFMYTAVETFVPCDLPGFIQL